MFKVGNLTVTWEKTPSKAKAVASKIASLPKQTSKKIAVWFSARVSTQMFGNMSQEKQEKVLENLKTYASEKSESMLRKDPSLDAQRDEYAANLNRIDNLEYEQNASEPSDEINAKIEELKSKNEKLEQEFEQKRQEFEQSILEDKYEPLKEIYDEIQNASILPTEETEEVKTEQPVTENKAEEDVVSNEEKVEDFVDYTVDDAKQMYEEEQRAKDLDESLEDKTKKYMGLDLDTITKPVSLENFMNQENNEANESISNVLVNLVQACATLYDGEYKDRIIEIIKTCNDKIEDEKKLNSSLSASLSETKTELKKAQEDNKDLSEKNNILSQENDRLEKSNNSRSETIKQQYEEIASKDEIIKGLKEELSNTKSMYETEHSLNESLRAERSSQQKEVSALRDRLDKLSEQTEILMKSNSMSISPSSSKAKEILTQARDEIVSQSERLATREELESLQKLTNGDSEVHRVKSL